MNRSKILLLWLVLLFAPALVLGQATGTAPYPAALSIDRIYNSPDFNPQGIGQIRWLKSGDAYSKIERAADGKGADLVSYDAATNKRPCRCKITNGQTTIKNCLFTPTRKKFGALIRAGIIGFWMWRAGN
jgi:hypothetical protein